MTRSSGRSWWFLSISFLAFSCGDPPPADVDLVEPFTSSELVGVPTNGYPSYQERLMLVAINRARSDPNNVPLQTAGQDPLPDGGVVISRYIAPAPPLMLSYPGSRCARFHCNNSVKTNSGLTHNSYCTLRSDIDATNCDGSEACACDSTRPKCFSCTTVGGCGTSPGARCGLFGFPLNGEVGAAGYGNGWAATIGWVTETPADSTEGHRFGLNGTGKNVIGLGYAVGGTCWNTFYFGDTGSDSTVTTAVLPAGVHRPETGTATTTFSFYVNYHHGSGAPLMINAVIDGVCYPMTKEIGTLATTGTYKVDRVVGTGCHQYWFIAVDAAGTRQVWPEQGAWGVGDCSAYVSAATPANCDTACTLGDSRACGLGICAGMQSCTTGGTWGTCNGAQPLAAEQCNGLDDTCDGLVPPDEADADGDGVRICAGDCNDLNAAVHPGATEVCDGADNDCDGTVFPGDVDGDNDGWAVCEGDCDDTKASVHPQATEVCDGLDTDCSGSVPAIERDSDGDGFRECNLDCDDGNASVFPGAAEACNNVDDDCDRGIDEGCSCPGNGSRACGPSTGICTPGNQRCQGGTWRDCSGGTAPVAEVCGDNVDNDCDSQTDECVAGSGSSSSGLPSSSNPPPSSSAVAPSSSRPPSSSSVAVSSSGTSSPAGSSASSSSVSTSASSSSGPVSSTSRRPPRSSSAPQSSSGVAITSSSALPPLSSSSLTMISSSALQEASSSSGSQGASVSGSASSQIVSPSTSQPGRTSSAGGATSGQGPSSSVPPSSSQPVSSGAVSSASDSSLDGGAEGFDSGTVMQHPPASGGDGDGGTPAVECACASTSATTPVASLLLGIAVAFSRRRRRSAR